MQTLTADEFKKKYGADATNAFDASQSNQNKDSSLWAEIQDIAARHKQENQQILSQPLANNNTSDPFNSLAPKNGGNFGETLARGTELAASNAGGILETAGAGLSKIPVVGPAGSAVVGAIGGAAKSGFNAITDKLAGTKFFQEAAAGLPEGNKTEQALRTASAGGQIAGDVLAADGSAYGLGKTAEGTSALASKIPKVEGRGPEPPAGPAGPSTLDEATTYLKGAVNDITPSRQGLIDHNIAKALDLTPSDLSNIEASTGNQVGKWMADNNLIGTNKATTQSAIDAFKTQNYNAVRSEIGKVTQSYKPTQVPRFIDALKAIKGQIDGTVGLEKVNAEIDNLLKKKTVTLNDVQRAKELMDDHFSLYKVTGDVASGVAKQGLANVRSGLKDFIEKQVQKYTGADIREMNNNVSTARSLSDAITTRSPRGLTRANITNRDVMTGLGLTYFGTPLLGIAYVLVKKLATSPTVRLRVARYLDQLTDAQRLKISEQLQKGSIPPDIQKITEPLL